MIIKAFRYMFYRFYTWQFKMYGYSTTPAAAAIGCIVVLLFWNIFTVNNISKIVFGKWLSVGKITLDQRLKFDLIVAIIFMIITDFYILKRIPKIIREFKNETRAQRSKRSIYLWTYILGTCILFITTLILVGYSHFKGLTVINYLRENINH
jgi:hypothetical protein